MITEIRENIGFIAIAALVLFLLHIGSKKMGRRGGITGS